MKKHTSLEEKISVLLSCKNCPDNKGGFICQKEYEEKCLAQKIQYIKELKEENAVVEKENAELKEKNDNLVASSKTIISLSDEIETRTMEQLTKARKIIGNLYAICKDNHYPNGSVLMEQAEQFLKEVSK